MHNYDVIIMGAGSAGVPTAMTLGALGVKTLVLDQKPSPGQGENKHAIGGIRATHSIPGKILACQRSLDVFATWEEIWGDNIEWVKGGYLFPVYRDVEENALKSLLPVQKAHGLEIDFISPEETLTVIPGLERQGLRGSIYSPNDGSASPLLAINAFYRRARARGATFRFNEKINTILLADQKVSGVQTDQGVYHAPVVVDALGAYSRPLCATVGVDLPVIPDSHEGAITEPVEPFSHCMVVDIRPAPGSANYYFYQNKHGQVVFCITPHPPIVGTDKRETSVFLPQVCARMVRLIPRLKHLRVRRVWRGLYPMTPDGSPLMGWNRDIQGLLHIAGLCGQGFMLGPGLGEVAARMLTANPDPQDQVILEEFSPYRTFSGKEALK